MSLAGAVDRGVPTPLSITSSEDCVMEDFPELPDRGTYRGRDGMARDDRHFVALGGTSKSSRGEFIDAGGDEVVVVARCRVTVGGSEVRMPRPSVGLQVRDGSIVRDRAFTSSGSSPRSRRAVGVGDVAGERGDGASGI